MAVAVAENLHLLIRRIGIAVLLALVIMPLRWCTPDVPAPCKPNVIEQDSVRASSVSHHVHVTKTIGAALKCPVR